MTILAGRFHSSRSRKAPGPGLAAAVLLVAALLAGPARAADEAKPGTPDLPPGAGSTWWSQVQQQIQASEYEITWQDRTALADLDAAWQAPNRAHGFRTYFTQAGIRMIPRAESEPRWEWGLGLIGYGRGSEVWPVEPASLRPSGNRVDCSRGGITEWYVNEAKGLKQGFTLDAPPEEIAAASGGQAEETIAPRGAQDGALEAGRSGSMVFVQFALTGTLDPAFSTDGRAIDFRTGGGVNVVHFAQLRVIDARGRELPAWMEGFAERGVRGVRILLDDSGAVYPIEIDPLATSPAWIAEGDQASANFGFSVATAGDVNGDGYADVIVGARSYDNGQTDEGRAYVYRGSAAGLLATPAWTAESDQASAYFGISVSTAGDVNGDGYADVIIGAHYYDNGQTDEGRAYVYHGSAAGLSATPAWVAESNQTSAYFGLSVSTAGDVNGDGFADVIVGAYRYDNGQTDEGRAYVYHGSAAGLSATAAWTAESDQASAYFGVSVATAGDVNGDGYSDVIVGAQSYDYGQSDEGRAYVYHGSAAGLSAGAAWTAESDQASAYFGRPVSTAGDVNGDGYADVIVATSYYDNGEMGEGRAYVYHGSAAGLSATAAWTAESNQASAYFGASVATAGDVNGDGYTDVIVGADLYDNGQTDEGRAYVYHGSAAGLSTGATWTAESNQASANFGGSVSTAGDVNGDGFADVIVGAAYYDNGQTDEGRAYVYHGSAAGLFSTAAWTAESTNSGSLFGFSVSTAGDVNGDGYADVIVGAPKFDGGEIDEGKAYVYHGSAAGLSATAAWTREANRAEACWGGSVSTAGDVNGDGYADVIIGAYDDGFAMCRQEEARVRVYHGSAAGLSAGAAWTAENEDPASWYAASVSTAGDVNGDGFADVIIGTRYYDNDQNGEGRAYVYHGSATGLSTTAAWTAEGDQDYARLGYSVSTAGDVNGDGYADVIVGAWGYDNGQTDEGRAYVYHGSAAGLSATAAWFAESDQASASFGASVSTAGDVNGDGYADVIVGAGFYDNGQTNEGRAYVYLGSAAGLASTAGWTAESDQASAYLGHSVSTAGDVNGDGYADAIVGAYYYDNGEADEGRAYVYHGSAAGLASTAAWTAESNLASGRLGASVSTAGDVNGDGYADVIVGQLSPGRACAYHGGGGLGVSLVPQQWQPVEDVPIGPLGRSDAWDRFRILMRGRSPFGSGRAKLEWEVKPLGTLFDGHDTAVSASWVELAGGAAQLTEVATGLSTDTPYHWRARLLYEPAATPFQQHSRWIAIPRNGWQEADLRTILAADFRVSQTDSPDPQFEGQPVEYHVVVTNDGPGAAAALLADTLPAGSAFLGASASQGSCSHLSGVVTCALGEIPGGGTADVFVQASAPMGAGAATNVVTVGAVQPAEDPDPGNNTSSESTEIRALEIGNLVWHDQDRDGIQDAGEPGLPGVVVLLYDGSGALLDFDDTDPVGHYVLTGLTYGAPYRLRFVLPVGYNFPPRDQGSDDALDSDADPVSGETATFALTEFADATAWDAGMHNCWAPDEPIYIYEVVLTDDGNNYVLLNFQDPNQTLQVTGYNVYRSDTPSLPRAEWPLVASDVLDMDEATPNKQWVDTSGDVPPSGIWYYLVAAYNNRCPAEGPI